jgi:hypothetical protein
VGWASEFRKHNQALRWKGLIEPKSIAYRDLSQPEARLPPGVPIRVAAETTHLNGPARVQAALPEEVEDLEGR